MTNLREKMNALAPWHHVVRIDERLTTREAAEPGDESVDYGNVLLVDDEVNFKELLTAVYPQGLGGRRLLESACNCGAYCFWARELGASECFGFDVRDHWIDQANFLLEHRQFPGDGIGFRVCDLYQLPDLGLEPFDIGMFKGILYHLPDPIGGLKLVADLTSELLIVNTACRTSWRQGLLINNESREKVMSGVHGLAWFPSSPQVVIEILRWLGFVEFRVLFWRRRRWRPSTARTLLQYAKNLISGTGRFEVIASRKKGLFDHLDRSGFQRRDF